MNILLAFNSHYFLPALVCLKSLLANNTWCQITVYVLYLDLKPEEIQRFADCAARWGNARVEFIRVPEEAFSVAQALDSFTQGGAWASFEEREKGCIAAGMAADFVVLGENPFEVNPQSINQIPVLATYLAGRPVYSAEDL